MKLRTGNVTIHIVYLNILLCFYTAEVKGCPPNFTRNLEKHVSRREEDRTRDTLLYRRNLQGKGIWNLPRFLSPKTEKFSLDFHTPKTLFYLFSAKFFHHIHLCFYITLLIAVKMAILKVFNLAIHFNSLRPTPSSSSSSLSPQRFPLISHRKSKCWTVSITSRVTVKSCRRGEKHLAIKREILDHNPRNNSLYYFPY